MVKRFTINITLIRNIRIIKIDNRSPIINLGNPAKIVVTGLIIDTRHIIRPLSEKRYVVPSGLVFLL